MNAALYMDDCFVTHYRVHIHIGWISMAWTSHHNENDHMMRRVIFSTYEYFSHLTAIQIDDGLTLVAFNLASVYLVVLFSTCNSYKG